MMGLCSIMLALRFRADVLWGLSVPTVPVRAPIIKLMLGIIKKDSGDIKLLGCDSDKLSNEVKERIGVVFDESFFPENMKLREIERVLANIYKNWEKLYLRDI